MYVRGRDKRGICFMRTMKETPVKSMNLKLVIILETDFSSPKNIFVYIICSNVTKMISLKH